MGNYPLLPDVINEDGNHLEKIFKKNDQPCSSLVRESIQNSLDAKLCRNKPVVVRFSISKTDSANKTHITDCLKEHIMASGLVDAKFFSDLISVPYLLIE